jgi:YVTN family beta-propeller protein
MSRLPSAILPRFALGAAAAMAVLAPAAAGATTDQAQALYGSCGTTPLGPPNGWDYVTVDPQTSRVYVGHSTEVTVVDPAAQQVVGRLTGLEAVHGVVVVPGLQKAYISSGGPDIGYVTEFDPKTLAKGERIETGLGSDSMIYDVGTKRLLVMNGRSQDAAIVDVATDKVVARVPLGGQPEAAASDNRGHVFVNIADTAEIVRIDVAGGTAVKRWALGDCSTPRGLTIDAAGARLFSSCGNSKMVVSDARTGSVSASFPIGAATDGAAFDPRRSRVVTAEGVGQLSVFEAARGAVRRLGQVASTPSGRTLALDPRTGRIYVPAADLEPNPQAETSRAKFRPKPGTLRLLCFAPR